MFLQLKMQDGTTRGARMQVTNVRKPLMSAADMNDAGQDVYFLASGHSHARSTQTVTVPRLTCHTIVRQVMTAVEREMDEEEELGVEGL